MRQFTTIEESIRIMEMGFPKDTARAYRRKDVFCKLDYSECWINHVEILQDSDDCGNLEKMKDWEGKMPAWSFDTILLLLPQQISFGIEQQRFVWNTYYYKGNCVVEYIGEKDKEPGITFRTNSFIKSAYLMLVWLYDNNKLK